jgi:rRNA maturation endonuclease Nob1
VADTYPRTDLQLLDAPHQEAGSCVVSLDPGYTCSMCGSTWPYQAVRNTGRCPACGSGLLRDRDGDCF